MKQKIRMLLFACCITLAGMAQEKPKTGLGKILGKADTLLKKADEKINSLITSPKNLTPVNGYVLTEKETKSPIEFSWTPVSPLPKEGVTYRLRVFEVRKGQTSSEAAKTVKLLEEKIVKNETSIACCVNPIVVWPIAESSQYGWNVEVLDARGNLITASSPTVFSGNPNPQQAMMMQQCVFKPTLDSIYCTGPCGNGKMGYRVRLKLDNSGINSNLMNFANAANYSLHTPIAAYSNVNSPNNIVQAWNTTPAPYGSPNTSITVVPVSPFFPPNILAGTTIYREVDICILATSSLPIRLRVFSSMVSTAGTPGLCDDDILITNLPPCPCTYCKEDMIVLSGQNTITHANNILTLNNTISIPGIQVKQFKAELIGMTYVPQNGNEQCWVCSKDDNSWGNFTGGTFSTPFPGMVNGVFPTMPCCGGNTHHTIGWWGNATTITNRPLQLQISLPPATTLSCCPYNITLCIRYTFTDAECRSCSVVRCFNYVRQPNNGGPIINVEAYELMEIGPAIKLNGLRTDDN